MATAENPPKKAKQNELASFITIKDEDMGYPLELFCIPTHYENDLESVLIPNGVILDRVEKLAQLIAKEFSNEPLTCLCVLKGGHQFFADLVDRIKKLNQNTPNSVRLVIDFIRVKSYENMDSTGTVKIIGGDSLEALKGCNVLIVEDIIDTGRTMTKLVKTIEGYDPKCVRVASLFVKRTPHSNGYRPHYTGFEVSNHFVVGYALDYNEHFRDLPHVCILNEHGKTKYAQ